MSQNVWSSHGCSKSERWDIHASSSPFCDTSYMPEISVDTLATAPAQGTGWFTWIGLRTGVMHESNGRVGTNPGTHPNDSDYPDERSAGMRWRGGGLEGHSEREAVDSVD